MLELATVYTASLPSDQPFPGHAHAAHPFHSLDILLTVCILYEDTICPCIEYFLYSCV